MISIVIPYFQRERGVLAQALRSIAAQRGCDLPLHTIVVDDRSPVPAADEVAAAGSLPGSVRVLVHDRNGGPAQARNSGLDAAPPGTQYIAFLDSDDEWSPDHLANALHALRAGHDFFFGDFYQLDQTVTAFARAGRIKPAEHPRLAGTEHLHSYQGDMLDQVIRGNVIGTPTVVYDFARLGTQRFRADFTSAGEDYLFWMAVAASGARIAFSSACEAVCGKGVNVYTGSGWGTEGHLRRVHNELRYRKSIAKLYPVNARQQADIDRSVATLREAFARDVLHRLRRRQQLPGGLLLSHLKSDPRSCVAIAVTLARLIAGRR